MAKSEKKMSWWPQSTSLAEWIAAGAGVLIFLGMVGSLIWFGIEQTSPVPEITVTAVDEPRAAAGGYIVRFRARNHSSTTAAHVRIEGQLRDGDQVVESRIAQLDYVPGRSVREGGFFFERNPREGSLQLEVTGYQDP